MVNILLSCAENFENPRPPGCRDVTAASRQLAALKKVAHPDRHGLGFAGVFERRLIEGRRAHSHGRIARKAEAFLRHHSQDPVGLAIGVLVMEQRDGVASGPDVIEHQLDLKRHSPVANSLLCGYANDFHLYFPTVKDAAAGGYGGVAATYVGVGAGEKLVTESKIAIGELTGRLKDKVGMFDFAFKELDASEV